MDFYNIAFSITVLFRVAKTAVWWERMCERSCAGFIVSRCFLIPPFFCAASRIRYEITAGNIGGAFAVKNETGAIYVASPLDYETRKSVSTNI